MAELHTPGGNVGVGVLSHPMLVLMRVKGSALNPDQVELTPAEARSVAKLLEESALEMERARRGKFDLTDQAK